MSDVRARRASLTAARSAICGAKTPGWRGGPECRFLALSMLDVERLSLQRTEHHLTVN